MQSGVRVTAGIECTVAGLDRQANNEDYGPYGQPEKMPVQEAASAGLSRGDRAGSTETVSDTSDSGQLECPSLGA